MSGARMVSHKSKLLNGPQYTYVPRAVRLELHADRMRRENAGVANVRAAAIKAWQGRKAAAIAKHREAFSQRDGAAA